MGKRTDLKYWNIPVTTHMDEIVEKAVKLDSHVSKSDLIRSAVREKLEAMRFKKELETLIKEDLS